MKMSNPYFRIEDHQQQIYQDGEMDIDCHSVTSKASQHVKLHEMEEQLEIAENRCNSLKDQLDEMKRLYQNKTDSGRNQKIPRPLSAVRKIPELKKYKATPRTCKDFNDIQNASDKLSTPVLTQSFHERDNISSSPDDTNVAMMKQNSQIISTDTSGAAVQTINNILNGITDSVNKLSQLHVKLEYDKPLAARKSRKLKDSACGDDQPEYSPRLESVPDQSDHGDHTQEDLNPRSSSIASLPSKSNVPRRKIRRKQQLNKRSTISVNITTKKSVKSTAKHVEKKFKMEPVKMVKHDSGSILSPKSKKSIQPPKRLMPTSRERMQKSKTLKTGSLDPEKLVEIYHNVAAKDTDSDESARGDIAKRKSKDRKFKSSSETVPSYTFDEQSSELIEPRPQTQQNVKTHSQLTQSQLTQKYYQQNVSQGDPGVLNYQRQLSPIDENTYSEPNAPRMECYNNMITCSRNYELPTIASKMKQVAKRYLREFNLNAIPFCPTKSTSPSHNIGINIQQVMNILKTRQPLSGISPTLAHNIGIAAGKLRNRSLSAMASTIGSRAGSSIRYERMACPLNRHSLNYHQLQEMAKEIPEEPDEEEAMESGAAGDTNRIFKWTSDPNKQKTCTCVPQKGNDFQQIYNKYQGSVYSTSTITQPIIQNNPMRVRCSSARQPFRTKTKVWSKPDKSLDTKPSTVLKGKEKNLKEVLTNLHNEFAYLNSEYENLSNKIAEMGNQPDEELVKQLENMERCLSNKEEEITMVMALYKEVVDLKQQVKVLKIKASTASVTLSQQMQMQQVVQPPQISRFRDYTDPLAAIHLTKLLRQIQVYQETNRIGRRS
ncbi:uncharacterized protein [Onthophagus taurus]|uniref:uncharacterized protein isoform X3 n=1 Tax=Onthophagus taurus TaxID=166361 RepID=UPI0039BEA331